MAFATHDVNSNNGEAPKASQACLSCRRQKRRCDKKIPACSLCERMNRACDYSDASPAPTSDDFNVLQQRVLELEGRLLGAAGNNSGHGQSYLHTPASTISTLSAGVQQPPTPAYTPSPSYQQVQNRFPAIAFLEAESFTRGRIEAPSTQIEIPLEILDLLGDGSAVQIVIRDYFDTVHTWMPIISKKRLTRNMLNPMWEAGPDLALLFLCMKLMGPRPQDDPEVIYNPIYAAAKRFISSLEASGIVSLMMLQAYILVALYELGHSIYPAAWMTVGACARYGQVLGIHDSERAPQLLPLVSSWTELEERRRTWWGVVILDRVVSIGSKGRVLACEDPRDRAALPATTSAWDEGQMASLNPPSVSSPLSDPLCPFARLCQASRLLGKVLRHHGQRDMPETERFQQASDLYLELSDLARILVHQAAMPQEYLAFTTPMSVCFSALCALCDPYACHGAGDQPANPEEAKMQTQAVDGLKTVSSSIKDFSDHLVSQTTNNVDIERVSPFVMETLYTAGANFAWDVRESGNESSQESLDSIRHNLGRFSGKWKSSDAYLRILEAQEFTYAAVASG
ncbi:hypothetical protein O988_01141 [Pseudogymnoascus sp. VKM F-3808]|nr:hypothetical protein O988_01141 [Pseudogymnoascus sp. VKM F-3808]